MTDNGCNARENLSAPFQQESSCVPQQSADRLVRKKMSPFQGTHLLSMDPKGRITLPANFRAICKKNGSVEDDKNISLTIYPGVDVVKSNRGEEYDEFFEYLQIFVSDQWADHLDAIVAGAEDKDAVEDDIIEMSQDCIDASLDSAGRLIISKDLRDTLGINDDDLKAGSIEAYLLGSRNWMELWLKQTYEKRKGSNLELKRRRASGTRRIKQIMLRVQ